MKRLLLLLVILISITLYQTSTTLVSSTEYDIVLGDVYYIMNDEIVPVTVDRVNIQHQEGKLVAAAEVYRTPDGEYG